MILKLLIFSLLLLYVNSLTCLQWNMWNGEDKKAVECKPGQKCLSQWYHIETGKVS